MNEDLAASFDAFVGRVRTRMEVGAQTYGDASLSRPLTELIDEVEAELADVCGWSAIAFHRLERLRARLQRLEINDA